MIPENGEVFEEFPWSEFQIVSLWDMERFYAGKFVEILGIMGALKVMAVEGPDSYPYMRQELLRMIPSLRKLLQSTGLDMSLLAVDELSGLLKRAREGCDFDASGFVGLNFGGDQGVPFAINVISKRIQDEFSTKFCFILGAKKESFYTQKEPLFGDVVQEKFPNMASDISEAGKCYAVGRYTACVFHLMRVMEQAVQILGVSFTGDKGIVDKDWHKIIDAIRTEVHLRYPDQKNKERIEHESLLALLTTVKRAWRNPTMHPKQTYTEEDAEDILQAVKSFMRELAKSYKG